MNWDHIDFCIFISRALLKDAVDFHDEQTGARLVEEVTPFLARC